ncbi:MAG TPA: TrkA C-terminal domain-containing protein, partial [Acidimicrobiales bacterium]|nr:TrkA C-terminal domain-containing protein [Acidimicrobiales bacterium]
QVMRRLFPETTVTEWTDPTGATCLLERELPESWAGEKLDDLEAGGLCRLVSVTRAGEVRLARAGLVGQEGDILHVLVPKGRIDELVSVLNAGRT